MNVDEVLAGVMRKLINANRGRYVGYVNFGGGPRGNFLTLDLTIEVTEPELDALAAAEVPA